MQTETVRFLRRSSKKLATLAVLFVLFYLFFLFFDYVSPFVFAFVIALLVNPIVNLLERKLKMSRPLAAVLVLILAFSLITFLITLVFSRLLAELVLLSYKLPVLVESMGGTFDNLLRQARNFYFGLPPELTDFLEKNLGSVVNWVTSTISSIINLGSIMTLIKALPGLFVVMLLTVISSYLLSLEFGNHHKWLRRLPPELAQSVRFLKSEIWAATIGMIKTQIIMLLVITLVTIFGLTLLRVPYALLIGIVIGLVDFLPILGTGSILIPWAVWAMVTRDFMLAGGLLVLYLLLIGVRRVLEPKILADTIGLNPLATLVSLFIGFKLFGVIGLLLGPFYLVLANAILKTRFFISWFDS